ncbi:SMI1/KNR4 family protein [Fulvivirga kasyanovii]|uniref:SMI1/KNR4 family protein n=1 Tax=Fulvivirga kasyanovii TaxID=396812 RepID=A0ABW9RYV7_9BACT|nr:SMI1/KNR4 family protein [Fulvivirga kasyanovii]MTI28990.1 SMI1/KNR4 family protein [Fulvivirga kasyanovii]
MAKYDFLKKYVNSDEASKHRLFAVDKEKIEEANYKLANGLPSELKDFYRDVGYGFLNKEDTNSFNRLMSPLQVASINLREDFYEHDPDLELYEEEEYRDKLIFFEVNEGIYLLIAEKETDGKNAIYYFDKKIADSLEEFLIRFDAEGHYFED